MTRNSQWRTKLCYSGIWELVRPQLVSDTTLETSLRAMRLQLEAVSWRKMWLWRPTQSSLRYGTLLAKNDTDHWHKCTISKLYYQFLSVNRDFVGKQWLQSWFMMWQAQIHLKSRKCGKRIVVTILLVYVYRIKELNEKAPANIQIVLVGNKIDMEQR